MMDMKAFAVDAAVALCRRFEGFYSLPYLCPAGVATIGYGATHYPSGRRVTLKDRAISREAGERMLLLMVEREYLPKVLMLCPRLIGESPERLAAIIDFTFNLGAGNLRSSTLRRKIDAGDWLAVPKELRKWNKAGGRILRGLTIRREAEANLI